MNGFAFQSKKYVESGIKVIRITNVQKGKIVDNDPQYYPPEAFDTIKDYMLEEGDLLMSLTGNCGRVGLLPLDMCPAALNQRVACLRLDETLINKKFMFATLNMDNFENDVMLAASGTAQKNMSTEWLKKYKVLIPPMEVQEQFADFVQQSDKSKFIGFKSQFIEMFGEEKIEDCRWPVMFMGDVFSITSSRRILKSEWKTEGNIPFIRVRDMVQLANKEPLTNEFFVSDEFYNSRPENEKVKAGDIIISATSTIGRTYVIKQGERFYFKDADVLLFRKKQEINEEFFTYGLTMPTVWTQIEGGLGATTVAHFLISKACKIKQPLPPIELQEEFALLLKQCDKSK